MKSWSFACVNGLSRVKYLWDDQARALREAVHRARDAYTRAVQKSKEVINDTPSGLPYADGVQRITNAAKEERVALEEYLRALRAFNDHANRKGKP